VLVVPGRISIHNIGKIGERKRNLEFKYTFEILLAEMEIFVGRSDQSFRI